MGELIKLRVEELPALCIVGKQLKVNMDKLPKENPIPAFWQKCFADEIFATLEKLKDLIFNDAYVGWMADWSNNDRYFTYVCGMLMKPGCPLPKETFVSRAIEPSTVAIGWIRGHQRGKFAPRHTNLLNKRWRSTAI